ncbi:ferritin heavy chain-like [Rhinolophus ferrumequinum]|uniref:ferritin heavy chain-like n=1 Tax=Rhinolophus ferrumequinum TaxID=59479 RepID=UPI00140F70AA|nr:ferritin heavy chain-like [Rhinolophus ferrumequinum]
MRKYRLYKRDTSRPIKPENLKYLQHKAKGIQGKFKNRSPTEGILLVLPASLLTYLGKPPLTQLLAALVACSCDTPRPSRRIRALASARTSSHDDRSRPRLSAKTTTPNARPAINYQISLELYASHKFETMASYFNCEDVAWKPFAQFFLQQSSLELQHAQSLMWLQNQRGGRLSLQDIYSPDPSCWENVLTVMECAFHLKMSVNQSLFDLQHLATEMKDAHLCDFLKSHYLLEQMQFIQELEDHITNLRKMGALETGLAEDLCAKLAVRDSDKN